MVKATIRQFCLSHKTLEQAVYLAKQPVRHQPVLSDILSKHTDSEVNILVSHVECQDNYTASQPVLAYLTTYRSAVVAE